MAQAALALGGLAGFAYPSDIEPSARWYGPGRDLVELVLLPDGTIAVPAHRPVIRAASLVPLAQLPDA